MLCYNQNVPLQKGPCYIMKKERITAATSCTNATESTRSPGGSTYVFLFQKYRVVPFTMTQLD